MGPKEYFQRREFYSKVKEERKKVTNKKLEDMQA